ncbi:MAG: hypothetical protein OXC48_01740 [Endozoicomonadaceae bacterium]|nr:hypothetical protein [Endozoicomonadaceae bacterium]
MFFKRKKKMSCSKNCSQIYTYKKDAYKKSNSEPIKIFSAKNYLHLVSIYLSFLLIFIAIPSFSVPTSLVPYSNALSGNSHNIFGINNTVPFSQSERESDEVSGLLQDGNSQQAILCGGETQENILKKSLSMINNIILNYYGNDTMPTFESNLNIKDVLRQCSFILALALPIAMAGFSYFYYKKIENNQNKHKNRDSTKQQALEQIAGALFLKVQEEQRQTTATEILLRKITTNRQLKDLANKLIFGIIAELNVRTSDIFEASAIMTKKNKCLWDYAKRLHRGTQEDQQPKNLPEALFLIIEENQQLQSLADELLIKTEEQPEPPQYSAICIAEETTPTTEPPQYSAIEPQQYSAICIAEETTSTTEPPRYSAICIAEETTSTTEPPRYSAICIAEETTSTTEPPQYSAIEPQQ